MNQFSAIIFSDTYNEINNELLTNRTLASIPFGGRFRMVDFVLSSLVHASVNNVAVITRRNYASLEDHLGRGRYWDLDHRNSGLRILSPFYRTKNNNEAFMARGKLDALRSIQPYIKSIREEYVVLSDANVIANIDFDCVFESHINSGADVTAIYSDHIANSHNHIVLEIDDNGRVCDMTYSEADNQLKKIALGIYILKRDLLMEIIRHADARDQYNFESSALIKNVDKLKIVGYEHKGFAQIVYTEKDYYNTSMMMLDSENRADVFNPKRPVITRVKDSVPTLYHYNAKIENSVIADGCHIDGTVKNSIIFRNVKIEAGAVVENSIIMQNTVIGKGSTLNSVILDKNNIVSENKNLCGAKEYPYVLVKNTEI